MFTMYDMEKSLECNYEVAKEIRLKSKWLQDKTLSRSMVKTIQI